MTAQHEERASDGAAGTGTADVTVIVPAYNALPYLLRGLQSLVDQTIGRDRMEVVVVDDGSTDGTGAVLDEWDARYPGLFRVVHAEASGGPAKPRNTGLDLARGRYVYFLDADDFLGVEALERLVRTADEQGSDIVLGKMATDSTRGIPSSMYAGTDLDADLYTSRVYWTLAALKLFRRSLLEDQHIRFPERFPNCSDQPFTATAYLRARRISVLADYDYYHVVKRDDGGHVTSRGSVANRLDVVETMCALLAREVPEQANRDLLMTRHFQVDLRHVVKGMARLGPTESQALFDRVVRLARTHLTPEVDRRLTPDMRVTYALVARGNLEDTLLAFTKFPDQTPYLVEGDRAYSQLSSFRNPYFGLDDDLFEATGRIRGRQRLQGFTFTGSTLVVTGTAALDRVAQPARVHLMACAPGERNGGLRGPAVDVAADGSFEATLDLGTGDRQRTRWNVFVVIAVEGVQRMNHLRATDPVDPSVSPKSGASAADGRGVAKAWVNDSGHLKITTGPSERRMAGALRRRLGGLRARLSSPSRTA